MALPGSEVETLKAELLGARHQNLVFERELEVAVSEAIAAREALDFCVLHAQTELLEDRGSASTIGRVDLCASSAADVPGGGDDTASARAEADAAALADALLASELALEAALAERDNLLRDQVDAKRSKETLKQLHANNEEREVHVQHEFQQMQQALNEAWEDNKLLASELLRSLTEEQAAKESRQAQAAGGATADVVAALEEETHSLRHHLEEREAAWANHSASQQHEVEELQRRLVAAWETNEIQAGEFVSSLSQVQRQFALQGAEQAASANPRASIKIPRGASPLPSPILSPSALRRPPSPRLAAPSASSTSSMLQWPTGASNGCSPRSSPARASSPPIGGPCGWASSAGQQSSPGQSGDRLRPLLLSTSWPTSSEQVPLGSLFPPAGACPGNDANGQTNGYLSSCSSSLKSPLERGFRPRGHGNLPNGSSSSPVSGASACQTSGLHAAATSPGRGVTPSWIARMEERLNLSVEPMTGAAWRDRNT